MEESERHRILSEAVKDAVDSGKAADIASKQAQLKRENRRRVNPWALLIGGWVAIAGIWLARPAFLFGPPPPPPPTGAVATATLRYAIFLEHHRIELYHDQTGRLPASLDQAGPTEAGVNYDHRGEEYQLWGDFGTGQLRFSRGMDPDSFLGASIAVLR